MTETNCHELSDDCPCGPRSEPVSAADPSAHHMMSVTRQWCLACGAEAVNGALPPIPCPGITGVVVEKDDDVPGANAGGIIANIRDEIRELRREGSVKTGGTYAELADLLETLLEPDAAPAGLPLHESADRDADNVPSDEERIDHLDGCDTEHLVGQSPCRCRCGKPVEEPAPKCEWHQARGVRRVRQLLRQERVRAYAEAIRREDTWALFHPIARAVMAVADREQAELRRRLRAAEGEVERLTDWQNDLTQRMSPEFDGDEAQEYLIDHWIESLTSRLAEGGES